MTAPPAVAERTASLDALGRESFDLLVIGGGITGVGIARDAAMRGWRTALVERADFASGTSSRSSRLVHGGVRYLEQGDLRLVFESSRERGTLQRIAPHLVRPLRFTWPVYAGDRVPVWKLRAGLALYDALSLFRNSPHRGLHARDVAEAEPSLRRDGLRGGAAYYDASTDDARLTIATAADAALHGATMVNHAAVDHLLLEGTRVVGAHVTCALTGCGVRVRASEVVNATGPWTDEIREMADPRARRTVRGTKGAHIAVPRDRVGNRDAITITSRSDGRVMFILPAGRLTIIGTTDTDYDGPLDDVRATAADVHYLLAAANAYVPESVLGPQDVVAAWAGVRPLVDAGGAPGEVSREHAIVRTAPGLLSVSGGKLTTYRAMAAEVVDTVARGRDNSRTAAPTTTTPLVGGAFQSLDREIADAAGAVGDAEIGAQLVGAHGSTWRNVWALARSTPALGERLVPALPYLAAEVVHAVTHEMACTVGDVLIRRLHVAFEQRDNGLAVATRTASLMAPHLGWSSDDVTRAVRAYAAEVARLFSVGA